MWKLKRMEDDNKASSLYTAKILRKTQSKTVALVWDCSMKGLRWNTELMENTGWGRWWRRSQGFSQWSPHVMVVVVGTSTAPPAHVLLVPPNVVAPSFLFITSGQLQRDVWGRVYRHRNGETSGWAHGAWSIAGFRTRPIIKEVPQDVASVWSIAPKSIMGLVWSLIIVAFLFHLWTTVIKSQSKILSTEIPQLGLTTA